MNGHFVCETVQGQMFPFVLLVIRWVLRGLKAQMNNGRLDIYLKAHLEHLLPRKTLYCMLTPDENSTAQIKSE